MSIPCDLVSGDASQGRSSGLAARGEIPTVDSFETWAQEDIGVPVDRSCRRSASTKSSRTTRVAAAAVELRCT